MMDQVHHLEQSTLAELRQIVALAEHLPGDTRVLARVRFGGADGARVKRIVLAAPRPGPNA